MTQDDLVELSRLFSLWLAVLPGESPVREVAEEIDKLIAHESMLHGYYRTKSTS